MSAPLFTVIAGANGCGKSTFTRWAKAYFQISAVLDPDAIAVELQATSSDSNAHPIDSGRKILESAAAFLEKRVSFSVETTLSGSTYLKMLKAAGELDFQTRLFYIGTEDVDINLKRVRARVLKGGHDVPEIDQLRRFPRSFKNLPVALTLVDEAVLFDNSLDTGPRVMGIQLDRTGMLFFEPLPQWAVALRQQISDRAK